MLREGDQAPSFELQSDDGETVRLEDLRGQKVVVYFYPKNDTPGCTREAIAFSAAAAQFARAGATVLGISRDSVASHCRFRDKYALKLRLLSDPSRATHEAYGAWGAKTMYGRKMEGAIRSTFVLDEAGRVRRVFPAVRVDGHVEAVLDALAGAAAGERRAAARSTSPVKGASAATAKSAAKGSPAETGSSAAKGTSAVKDASAARGTAVVKHASGATSTSTSAAKSTRAAEGTPGAKGTSAAKKVLPGKGDGSRTGRGR